MSATGHTSPLLLCAHQELVLAVRSRWTQIFAAVFAALSLAVAGSGYILSGGAGFQDFARTAASLVQLVLLLTPLTSLVIGVLALAPERGSAELLFSQPVSRRSILLGRLLGLFAALGAGQAIGLGGAGLVFFSRSVADGLAGSGVDRCPVRVGCLGEVSLPDCLDSCELVFRVRVERRDVHDIVERAACSVEDGLEVVESQLDLAFEIGFGCSIVTASDLPRNKKQIA